jgi:hypothetical protein
MDTNNNSLKLFQEKREKMNKLKKEEESKKMFFFLISTMYTHIKWKEINSNSKIDE